MEAAYSAFLSGDDDGYQPLFADLQKKIGKLLCPRPVGGGGGGIKR